MPKRKGLTKPLVNNIGGVVDQDAPSADQLLHGKPDPTWGDTPVIAGDHGMHPSISGEDEVMPGPFYPRDRPESSPSDRTPGRGLAAPDPYGEGPPGSHSH